MTPSEIFQYHEERYENLHGREPEHQFYTGMVILGYYLDREIEKHMWIDFENRDIVIGGMDQYRQKISQENVSKLIKLGWHFVYDENKPDRCGWAYGIKS